MNPSFRRKPWTPQWASSNSTCALLCALPIPTQENNYIWMLDSLISASVQSYTNSMTKTSEWSLMPAKRCFPQNSSIQTAKKLCFALSGSFNVSLITLVHIKSSSRLVTFLNSQRIMDGVVTNARIAIWLMTLQGWDVEARYAQNNKSSIGNGLAACQNCSTDMLYTSAEPPQPQLTNHRYFEENVCERMPTAYVDGCSYNRKGNLKPGVGVVWLNNDRVHHNNSN